MFNLQKLTLLGAVLVLVPFIIISLEEYTPLTTIHIYPYFRSTPQQSYPLHMFHAVQKSSEFTELSNFYARYTYGNRQARGMKIAHFNKGSGFLATKKNEIEGIIAGLHPHIFGISEANLFQSQDLQDVQISDYTLHTCPTLSNPELGYSRIVVYSHKSVVCKPRPDLMSSDSSSIWVQVGLPRQKQFLVCQTYREWQLLGQNDSSSKTIPAQLGRWATFLDQWERALQSGMEVIVCGDMNLNHLDWGLPKNRQSGQTRKLSSLIELLFQQILPHSVSQCVTVATRFVPGQAQTGLDHVYTNRPDKLSPVQAQFCGGSDHKLIFTTRYSRVITRSVRYVRKRCYKSFDPIVFLSEVQGLSWWDLFQTEDVDLAVEIFSKKLTRILDRLAPVRTIQTRRKYVPWLSQETKILMQQRDQAQTRAARTRSQEDWIIYKRLRNQVTCRLKSEESSWQGRKLRDCSRSPSEQWQYVLGWLGWKSSGSPNQLFYGGRLLNRPSEIADCQNEYFVDKVQQVRENLPGQVSDPLSKLKFLMRNRGCSFNLQAVHPDTVGKILASLKNSKSCGLDSIDTFTLKLAAPYIIPALTHLVNLSIATQTFPSMWKTSKVIPLYKKDDPLCPKNYRPVAILPIISKILEKCVFIQIIEYMETNQLLHPNHHGFRSHHNTTTGLIQLYDSWVEAIERKEFAGVCFLDLSAAFDIVDHSLLLQKLELYGFSDTSLQWVNSYLSGRSQTVYIEGTQSKVLPVPNGVPQGSILGPLFYVIFTNELPELVHHHQPSPDQKYNMSCRPCGTLCCYADDSSFSSTSSSLEYIETQLKNNYDTISTFMNNNKLKLNSDKTHLMLLGTDSAWRNKLSPRSICLDTGQEIIQTTESEKLLGGFIAQNLKWTNHILLNENSLVKQLGIRVIALKKISRVADFKTRKMFADGLFMSKLIYLIPLWGGCEKFLIKSLQVVQNKAARTVTRMGIYTPVQILLQQCNWLSVHQLVFYHTIILLYKTVQSQKPKYLYDMTSTELIYETRADNAGKLRVVADYIPVQGLTWKSYKWRSVRSWNLLPANIRTMKHLASFKSELKSWVLENIDINP